MARQHDPIQDVLDFLEQHPASGLSDEAKSEIDTLAEHLEVLCLHARGQDVPLDTPGLGGQLLDWWLASGIGMVGAWSTSILNIIVGRPALERRLASYDGWAMVPTLTCREDSTGYAIVNQGLITASRLADPPEEPDLVVAIPVCILDLTSQGGTLN